MNVVLLLVEDDPLVYDALVPYVKREGWALQWARSVDEARSALAEGRPAAVLLDRMLPGEPGDVLADELNLAGIPFLLLTARSAEIERLTGFDLGADDYIVKPFSAAELMRRVDVVLRRRGTQRLRLGEGLELDREAHRLRAHGRDLALTATEYALLECLARRPGRIFSRTELATLLDLDFETSDRTIDSHVKNIRKRLRAAGVDGDLIATAIGIGYSIRSLP
ncbi:MAG: response regulator transcription factor [Vulcanimicrobiaceae bacterium]